jgi:hypothetical protein
MSEPRNPSQQPTDDDEDPYRNYTGRPDDVDPDSPPSPQKSTSRKESK